MEETMKEKFDLANLYLERMAAGKFPFSDITAERESDLNNAEAIRGLYFVLDFVKALEIENTQRVQNTQSRSKNRKTTGRLFPVECLAEFKYEEDKAITNFVSQLKGYSMAGNVKGMSTKAITDWLKANDYLMDTLDSVTGNKITVITKAGEEAGLYSELRHSRFGQEYEVIMYSEKAQNWLVENMDKIVN